MDWMYKGVSGLVDREEYLKGRRIDKTFEVIDAAENPSAKGDLDAFEPAIPNSVLEPDQVGQSSLVTIDLAAKLREDPLYEIRVKQREERKKLLQNPLKLKKLKNILESTLKDDTKHKKGKKRKKRRYSRSRSSSSSDSSSSESNSDHQSSRRHRDRSYDKKDHKRRHSSERRQHKTRDSSRDEERHRERRDDRKYDQSLKKVKNDDSRIPKRYNDKKPNDSKPKKLTAEELAKKREEMLNNAVWRECQRKSNVKSYKEEEQKEIEFNSTGKSAQFIKPLLKSATESQSVEDRIKQKRFRSQRGPDTMDKNFARR